MSVSIALDRLTKDFGAFRAVDDVSLDIAPGELFFLLGPSGCGKTTLLRIIAGFIQPTGGRVRFAGRDVTRLPPNKRRIGMVFQSYALWPHMTVAQNVAFGLAARKVPRPERDRRAKEALRAVQMEELSDRKPGQLSGGQQQRVALARALVVEPDVLLLDEPLSNLDAKLRNEMRAEIRRLCRATGITTIYVTHDQKEALSMADRIAVLRKGRIDQVGSPQELYDRPRTRFAADFLGDTNFLEAQVIGATDDVVELEGPAGRLTAAATRETLPQDRVVCSIRPEAFRIAADTDSGNILAGRRIETVYFGDTAQHVVELPGGQTVRVSELHPVRLSRGEDMRLTVEPRDVVVVSDEAPDMAVETAAGATSSVASGAAGG